MNRDHLLGAAAPEHLFFKVDAIDERLPPMADGLSWPVILQRYSPSAMQCDYLVLDRRTDAAPALPVPSSPEMTGQTLGEWVTVPSNGGAWRVEMDIRPTLYGRLAMLLFKPSQLRIELDLADGTRWGWTASGSTVSKSGSARDKAGAGRFVSAVADESRFRSPGRHTDDVGRAL